MTISSAQTPSAVVKIRPHNFGVNQETAADNAFQINSGNMDHIQLVRSAYEELTVAAQRFEPAGVRAHIFEDEGLETPDENGV